MDVQASWRRVLLPTAAGIGLAASGVRFYFTHPQRVFAATPTDLLPRAQDVIRTASDGAKLHAIWLTVASDGDAGRTGRTIVHHHGYGSCGGTVLARKPEPLTAWPLVRVALGIGFNVLLIDARSHGRSGGSWDPKGNRAADDMAGWVKWLREEQAQDQVGLWGNSFGSVVGLMILANQGPAGGDVGDAKLDAMVLDSPAISSQGLYSGVVHGPLYWVMQPVMKRLANGELLGQLKETRACNPVLFIHGMDDHHVPPWHSEEAYRLLWSRDDPERVELWLVPGADHLEAFELAPETYTNRCLQWFDKWMPKDPTDDRSRT